MTRDQAIEEIRRSWKKLYPADKSGKGIVCPLCGNGASGGAGDGIRENPKANPGALHCFKCGFSGDVLDLMKQERHISFQEAAQEAAAALNILMDEKPGRQNGPRMNKKAKSQATEQPERATQNRGNLKPLKDYTEYYQTCRARLMDPAAVSYITGRGISMETAEAAGLGFDPKADPAESGHPSARIIIPTTKQHYIARSIDPGIKKDYKALNNKGGKPGLFNEAALWNEDAGAVFICEGAFDALSFVEAGAAAVALNSTSNVRILLDELEKKRTDAALILCLDNDEAGRGAAAELNRGLNRLNISHQTKLISRSAKDPNEALCADREAFIRAVRQAVQETTRPENVTDYIDTLLEREIQEFSNGDKKTGFSNLDKQAGGLYPGLYVLAASSSLGKTTFIHQMADQLAESGEDVLFFSMEQSRLEMVSKSLARILNRRGIKASSLDVRMGRIRQEDLATAAGEYTQKVGNRLSVIEGNFNCDEGYIEEKVRKYIRQNKCRPIVIIDYLQILQIAEWMDKGITTKEVMDKTVTALKRLSRELDITIILISSINRTNYLMPIDFESIKESGGIEYTADVVWGLQLQCLEEELFSTQNKIKEKRERIKEAKAEIPRKIELVCLKNRYGISSYSCGFSYYPDRDLFTEKALPRSRKDIPEY